MVVVTTTIEREENITTVETNDILSKIVVRPRVTKKKVYLSCIQGVVAMVTARGAITVEKWVFWKNMLEEA